MAGKLNDIIRHDVAAKLDAGMTMLVGASFKSALPQSYNEIELLRELRGQVAHGRSPVRSKASEPLNTTHLTRIILAALDAFRWLNEFKPDS